MSKNKAEVGEEDDETKWETDGRAKSSESHLLLPLLLIFLFLSGPYSSVASILLSVSFSCGCLAFNGSSDNQLALLSLSLSPVPDCLSPENDMFSPRLYRARSLSDAYHHVPTCQRGPLWQSLHAQLEHNGASEDDDNIPSHCAVVSYSVRPFDGSGLVFYRFLPPRNWPPVVVVVGRYDLIA